jgi:hypothetical protein
MGYGRRQWREAGPQIAVPPRTDPIEHQATRSWPMESANGNVALRGIASNESPEATTLALDTACLLMEPHRRGLRQAQGVAEEGEGSHAGGPRRGDRLGTGRGERTGRAGLVRALRLPTEGSTTLRTAAVYAFAKAQGHRKGRKRVGGS